jgi:hypothetical protein
MNIFEKLNDIKKRINESPSNKAIYFGMLNYYTSSKKALQLAKKRYFDSCMNCEHFVKEENELLQVEDKLFDKLTNRKCNDCGCVASFKLRQNEIKCNKWEE